MPFFQKEVRLMEKRLRLRDRLVAAYWSVIGMLSAAVCTVHPVMADSIFLFFLLVGGKAAVGTGLLAQTAIQFFQLFLYGSLRLCNREGFPVLQRSGNPCEDEANRAFYSSLVVRFRNTGTGKSKFMIPVEINCCQCTTVPELVTSLSGASDQSGRFW